MLKETKTVAGVTKKILFRLPDTNNYPDASRWSVGESHPGSRSKTMDRILTYFPFLIIANLVLNPPVNSRTYHYLQY